MELLKTGYIEELTLEWIERLFLSFRIMLGLIAGVVMSVLHCYFRMHHIEESQEEEARKYINMTKRGFFFVHLRNNTVILFFKISNCYYSSIVMQNEERKDFFTCWTIRSLEGAQ